MSSAKTIDTKYLNLNDFTPMEFNKEFLISKHGLIFNTMTQNFIKPTFHKNILEYYVNLQSTQYLIKNLLYTTFINSNFQVNSKTYIQISNRNLDTSLLFLNFTLSDLEEVSKSDAIKKQARNNRIINKYDLDMNFICSYTKKADILAELNIKDPKPVTKCLAGSRDNYKGFIFKYDDVDDIKNTTDQLEKIKLKPNEKNIVSDESFEIEYDDYDGEIWARLNESEYHKCYEISNYGRFRNCKTEKILKQHISANYKYCNINIYDPIKNKKQVKKERTNVLVARYFINIPDELKEHKKIVVDHIDNNKFNNYYTNLQYITHGQNISKRYGN